MTRAVWIAVIVAVLAAIAVQEASAVNVVGIDFGSEWIKVAMVKAGAGVQIVLNDASKRKSPNVLGIDQDYRSFGDVALSKPHLSYGRVRELLGKRYNQTYLSSFPKHYFGFDIKESEDRGSFGVVHQTNSSQIMQPEEVTAMVLSFVAEMAAQHGKEPVSDVVITVPSYYTQFERQAMLDAAEIAGLSVLSLVSDHTALALKFGFDHKVENLEKPINVLFYNMGSTATVVSIVTFDAIPDEAAGKNKTQGVLEVQAVAWDTTLGGFALTSLVVDEIVTRSGKAEELAKRPRNMGKLRKEAEKTKMVLSANKEAMTMIESLIPDYDFKGMITRSDLEEAASRSAYWERVLQPVEKALKQAKMEKTDIDRIEMLGGAWRVPRVQEVLKNYFDPTVARELDKTLNADESFCYGAALHAASLSTAFRLRKFTVKDKFPFKVSIDLDATGGAVDAEEEETAAKEEGKEEAAAEPAAAAAPKGQRNIQLFGHGKNVMPSKRRMKFKRDDDFTFRMKYDNIEDLPPNTPSLIGLFNVTGIAAAVAKYPNATKPQVSVSFRLLRDGMVEVEGGEAELWETVEVEECDKPKKKKSNKKPKVTDADKLVKYLSADENKDDFLSKEEFQVSANTEYGVEKDSKVDGVASAIFVDLDLDKDGFLTRLEYLKLNGTLKDVVTDKLAAADKEESGEEEAKEGADEEAKTDSATNTTATAEEDEKPQCRMKPQKRVHRVPLKINLESGGMPPMSTKQKRASRRVLQEFEERERLQKDKAQAHNDLESYTYSARDKLESSEFQAVSSEAQRAEISEAVTKAASWLDEESFKAKTAEFKEQLSILKELVDPVLLRIIESETRTKAISDGRAFVSKMLSDISTTRKLKPWLTDVDAKEVEDKLEKYEVWLNESVAEQQKRAPHESPVFLSPEVAAKWEPVASAFRRFDRIPKPKPPPPPKVKKTNSTSADNGTATVNVTSSSSTESEQEEQPTAEETPKTEKTTSTNADDTTATKSEKKAEQNSEDGGDDDEVTGEATFESGTASGKSEL